jgi:hypothetical protein
MKNPDFEKLSLLDEPAGKINQRNLNDIPFGVTFKWQQTSITVQLDNGEDVLKLPQVFSDFLTKNNIPNTIKPYEPTY